jgi:hypothetical protein
MRFKVHGGTMSHSEQPLCNTCSHSSIIRGRSLDEEIIDCRVIGLGFRRITFRVTSCSDYNDARLPSMMQLMENAWILRRGSQSRPAGFIHGRDLRAEEMARLIADSEIDDEEE